MPRQPGDAAAMAAVEAAASAAAAAAAAEEHYDPLAAGAELQGGRGQGAAEAGAAGLEQQRAAAEAAGFVYDPESGYMRDPASGYYYDANTGEGTRCRFRSQPTFCRCAETSSAQL